MSLDQFLEMRCGAGFAYSNLWFRDDGSIPYMWIWGPAKPGQAHEPVATYDVHTPLTRFTALRFPA